MDLGESLETTPTWAVAVVCSILILVSLLMEHALHLLSHYVKKRKRKTLNQAVYHLKSELRSLGFMSLLLTMAKQPISKICIPKILGDTFLPCNDMRNFHIQREEVDSCGKGKVPLLSTEGTLQLQMLIFVLAIFHVVSCLVTFALSEVKVCFLRQFTDSVSKVDYFALRNGFISSHLSKDSTFDFHKFLTRSIDQDFHMIVRISCGNWLYAVLVIFFSAQEFYNHYWLPFIPLVILLVIGTKLMVVVTNLCLKTSTQRVMTTGLVSVDLDDYLFWFGRPKLILHAIRFILIQNSFQLAFFTWTWYKFGFQSCFHREAVDVVLTVAVSVLVQFLCAYITLPLYALVNQMGSSMKETVFTDDIVWGLKKWHRMSRKRLVKKKSLSTTEITMTKQVSQTSERKESVATTSLMKPLPCPWIDISRLQKQSSASQFKYPSGRLELMEIQRVAEEMIVCGTNNIPFHGEISFRSYLEEGKRTF